MSNVLTPELWDDIRTREELVREAPDWARAFLAMSFEEAMSLPFDIKARITSRPVAEYAVMDSSYLEFLRQQININARGDAWSDILRKRLAALQDHAGKELLWVDIYDHWNRLRIELLGSTLEILYWETGSYYYE